MYVQSESSIKDVCELTMSSQSDDSDALSSSDLFFCLLGIGSSANRKTLALGVVVVVVVATSSSHERVRLRTIPMELTKFDPGW